MLQSRSTLRRIAAYSVVAGVLSLCSHTASRADIVVKGSNGKKATELNAWCLHHIPTVFRPQTDVVVRQLNDPEMNSYLTGDDQGNNNNDRSSSDDDDIDGVFENDPPRITLRLPSSGEPDMFTFTHEYGHFVWFDLMSKDDRKEYEAIYKKQHAAHHLVTRYAATDLEEGFAEAFSFYINEAPVLQHRDPASYAFLSQWQAQAQAQSANQTADNR
jgi:hypothetical protein